MLAPWTNLLPVFVARWMARRWGERFELGGAVMAQGQRDTLFVVRPAPQPCGIADPRGCWRVRCQLARRCAGPMHTRNPTPSDTTVAESDPR